MSIALMTLAWRTNLPATQKLALLALCDWANDEGGSLHPSIASVAKRIGTSSRQAQRVVHGLIDDGWAVVAGNADGGAPGSSRRYVLNVAKLRAAASDTDDADVTRKASHTTPETGDASVTGDKLSRVTPVSETGDTSVVPRVTPMSPKPPMNHQGTVKKETRSSRVAKPDGVPDSVWADFNAQRKAKRAPLNETALRGIAREADKAGLSLADALAMCCERGWQSFKADWAGVQETAKAVGQKEREWWLALGYGDEAMAIRDGHTPPERRTA